MLIDPNLYPIADGSSAFFDLLIGSWFNSHESGHIVTDDGMGDCGTQNILNPQTTYRCLASGQFDFGGQIITTTEGIFTNVPIFSDPTIRYSLSASYKKITCNTGFDGGRLNFSFTDGLVNSNSTTTIPNPSNIFNVGFVDVDNINLQETVFDDLLPTMNFSQIWVTSSTDQFLSVAEIVDVTLTCRTLALNGITETRINTNLYTFVADASKQFASYSWSIDGNVVSTNPTLNYTFEDDGVYSVCLDVIDEYGCCAQVCELVAIDSFCDVPADAIIIYDCYDGVFDGVVNLTDVITTTFAPISNRTFYIAPYTELNVNSFFTQFNDCIFQCDEGSMIRSSTPFFSIVNSTLHGCEKMWKGIYDNEATFDNFIGNRILDAEFGINIINGNSVTISNNFFEDDYIGINFPSSEITSTRGNIISGNVFRGVNGLLPAYNGQFRPKEITYCGIRAYFLDNLNLSGGNNVFQDIHNGILTISSSVNCVNNSFRDLIGEDGMSVGFNGNDEGIGIGFFEPNTINIENTIVDNCYRGIDGQRNDNSIISIEESTIISCNRSNSSKGISLYDGNNTTIGINNNFNIENNQNPISIRKFNSSDITIDGNRSLIDNAPLTFQQSMIYLSQLNNLTTTTVSNNTIFLDKSGFNAYFGVNVQNSMNVNLTNNEIRSSGFGNGVGIGLFNLNDCVIEENLIETVATGFWAGGNSNPHYKCNLTRDCFTGFYFFNPNLNSDMHTNKIVNSGFYSLHLKNATISDQLHKGNIFIGDDNEGFLDNSPFNGNQFTYNASNPIPAPFDAVPYLPSDWVPEVLNLGGSTGIWFDINNQSNNLTCIGGPRNLEGFPMQQFESIANGESYGTQYFDQNLWTSQWQLIRTIDSNPELLTNTILEDFYQADTDVRKYYDINQSIKNLNDVIAEDNTLLTNTKEVYSAKMLEMEALLTTINEYNYIDNKLNLENLNAEITLLNNEMLAIKAQMRSDLEKSALAMKPLIQSLAEPYGFNEDFKTVFNAQVDLIVENQDFVKENYGDQLKSIAESCEFEIGIPYYEARDLCYLLGIEFQDNACVEVRNTEEIATIIKDVKIRPNPSSSLITLDTDLEIKNFEIYSADGTLIQVNKYTITNSNTIDISNLKEGIYIIKVRDVNNLEYFSKFIKI